MSLYSYMPNFETATRFLTDWWQGRETGRPALFITAENDEVPELLPMPDIEGIFCPTMSLKSIEYRLAHENNRLAKMKYFAEGMAIANPTIGPGAYSLFLGGEPVEDRTTVWVDPWFKNINDVKIEFDENNPYWQYNLNLLKRMAEFGKDKFLVMSQTVTDGLDILSSMIGPEQLLYEIVDHPEIVIRKNIEIGDYLLKAYNSVFDIIKDKTGGSVYLFWSQGRMFRHQCDFAAMLSPQMFREFALPELRRILATMNQNIYHWDGPGALCHLDALLEADEIDVIQWVPGAGNNPNWHSKWWKMYHKILDSGKRIQFASSCDMENILPMKKEFGKDFYKFMIIFGSPFKTAKDAQNAVNLLSS